MSDLVEQVYIDLEKLVWRMAYDAANSNANWRLEPDELASELFVEMVKVCEHYPDLNLVDLKSVVVVSLYNRVSDVRRMVFGTHRKAETNMLSLDYVNEDEGGGDGRDNHEKLFGREDARYFDLPGFIDGLPNDARRLVLEVLWPSDRTRFQMKLFLTRKMENCRSDNWEFRLTPLMMARALGWGMTRLKDAWEDVHYALTLA